MHYPQSSPPPASLVQAYPSPRSKSPPSSRLVRKLPTSTRYPLSDITNFSLSQAASELVPNTPHLGGWQIQDSVALRSPIPLVSQLHSPPRTSFEFRAPIFEPSPLVDLISPDSPRPAPLRRWTTKRRATPTPCSPPPSPTHRPRKYPQFNPLFSLPHRPPPPPPPPPPPLILPRKKRTKREFTDLQWQVTIHRSLAWRLRKYTQATSARGGLMIAFAEAEPHWTDALDLDRRLVSRLWEGLLKQGCRPVGAQGATPVHKPIPSHPPPTSVPFPVLAPPIQLEPSVSSGAHDSLACVPRRVRVSALTFSAPSPSMSVDSVSATPPKGTLLPAQLVAQTLLRRSQTRAKPIRRSNALQRDAMLSGLGPVDGE